MFFGIYFADQLPLCIVVQDGLEQLKTQKQFITQNHPSRIVQKCCNQQGGMNFWKVLVEPGGEGDNSKPAQKKDLLGSNIGLLF
jgi:hypothetical protein